MLLHRVYLGHEILQESDTGERWDLNVRFLQRNELL